MRRSIAGVALCLVLPACAEPVPHPPGLPRAEAAVPGPGAEAVEIVVADLPAGHEVREVALIDPAGVRHPAERLAPALREGGVAAPGAGIGLGVSGGSSSGIRPSLSLGLGTGMREETYRSRRVIARVPLADPAALQGEAWRWRVEVVYVDVTGERRRLVLSLAGAEP